MPVRYDIAAQVPQYGGGFDPMNMFAQMQTMDYRQRQNALAEMQMAEYARKLQAMQQLRGISPNFEDPRFAQQTWQYDPETAMQVQNVIRQGAAQRATEEAQRAAAGYHTGMLGLARQKQQLETPEIMAKGRKETAAATGEDIKAAQRLVAPAFMARDPETFAARYAQVYPDLPASVQKRLGARPEMQDIEAFLSTPEEILQARKPISGVKAGETIVTPTGRPGEPAIAVEPEYRAPNAMVTNQPGMNNLAQQGRMPPIAADVNAPVDPIVARALRKQATLQQLPPGPARETAGARMDLRDTLDEVTSGLGALRDAGGIPQAGASTAANWKAAFRKSPTGQALGGLSDSEVNAQLAALRTTSAVLKAQLRKGLEMGITQMDAVKEAEKLDAAFLNPDKIKGLSEGYASVEALRRLLGGGETAKPAARGKAGEESKPTGGIVDWGSLK
jgi:hypothetical protein